MAGLDEPTILSLLDEMHREGRLLYGLATLMAETRVLVYAMDEHFEEGHTPSSTAPQ